MTMTTTTASQHHLRRVFTENFSAADIAEPLASFDASTTAADALAVMARRAYKVAGIRKDGTICGYVRQEELTALRNNLAHAQDIIACDWDIIVKLTEFLDSRFALPG